MPTSIDLPMSVSVPLVPFVPLYGFTFNVPLITIDRAYVWHPPSSYTSPAGTIRSLESSITDDLANRRYSGPDAPRGRAGVTSIVKAINIAMNAKRPMPIHHKYVDARQ
jgi:hypothetical protein